MVGLKKCYDLYYYHRSTAILAHSLFFAIWCRTLLLPMVAGPTSVPTPPTGCLLPAQLSEECEVDAETLIGLIRAGWLEVSPSARSG